MIEDEDKLFRAEMESLLMCILYCYGYDFRNYSKAHLKRRLKSFLNKHSFNSLSHLQHEILRNKTLFSQLLLHLSINTTEMFRDPIFYKTLKEKVFPILKTYPFFKIWHAGCSTGEEVYSLAIFLKENKLYDRAQIYATDFNTVALEKAKEGIYPVEFIKLYTTNYIKAGGDREFSDYYHAAYDNIILNNDLKSNILFATHNLSVDTVFSEMNLILCRNVLIYFNNDLQERVLKIFQESLNNGSFLCLGTKEILKGSSVVDSFELIDLQSKIYKLKYH